MSFIIVPKVSFYDSTNLFSAMMLIFLSPTLIFIVIILLKMSAEMNKTIYVISEEKNFGIIFEANASETYICMLYGYVTS